MQLLFILLLSIIFSSTEDVFYKVVYYDHGRSKEILHKAILINNGDVYMKFQDYRSGKKYKIPKNYVHAVYNLNNGKLFYIDPSHPLLQAGSTDTYNSAGKDISQSANMMLLSDLLPLIGYALIYAEPGIGLGCVLTGFLIKILAYQKLAMAGAKLDEQLK